MELRIIVGSFRAPYVEITGELDYKLSADTAAESFKQMWNEKIVPLQFGLCASDAERRNFEEKLIQRISEEFSLKNQGECEKCQQ